MSEPLTLDLVDRDGAIREAHDEGMSRSTLFRRAVVGGGTFLAGGLLVGGLPSVALGKPSAAQDVKILNFALRFAPVSYVASTREVDRLAGSMWRSIDALTAAVVSGSPLPKRMSGRSFSGAVTLWKPAGK